MNVNKNFECYLWAQATPVVREGRVGRRRWGSGTFRACLAAPLPRPTMTGTLTCQAGPVAPRAPPTYGLVRAASREPRLHGNFPSFDSNFCQFVGIKREPFAPFRTGGAPHRHTPNHHRPHRGAPVKRRRNRIVLCLNSDQSEVNTRAQFYTPPPTSYHAPKQISRKRAFFAVIFHPLTNSFPTRSFLHFFYIFTVTRITDLNRKEL